MKKNSLLMVVKVTLAVSLTLVCVSTHALALEWKFTPGDVQNYRLTQSASLASGEKPVIAVKQEYEVVRRIIEVNSDGSAKLGLKIAAISFLATGPGGQEVRYDSDSTVEPDGYAAMLAPIGKQLAESEVVLTMAPNGKVSDVIIPEAISEVVKTVPGGKKFSQDGGLNSFISLARLGMPDELPKGDAEGKEWTEKRPMELPHLGTIHSVFTYKVGGSPSNDKTVIQQQMVIDTEGADEPPAISNQKSEGEIEFDQEQGRPEQSTLTYEAEFQQAEQEAGPMMLEYKFEFQRVADDSQ